MNEDEKARRFVDRHYPEIARFLQSRTVTLDTVDHGQVQLDEPAWCIGHGTEMGRPVYRDDITHNSVRVKAGAVTESQGWMPMLTAYVSWAPFREVVPVISLVLDAEGDFAAEDGRAVAEALRVAASRVEQIATEAIRLRDAAQ
ncbi:hypothetical protein ACH49_01355 [Streptomyces leeuwenhoekii]|uniref:Uncharacterized protein n=1 Tax=Streptomyces leeuwenhoekii TaxID=1437453 RepID=A0ABR5I5N5_STRLW|nr:hypothetical protein [Streptomyces leeuwenhoekii]KMS81806.1 hypothetical protein ACH49_01355 [Streptomyces leeuwenhoekii]